MWPARKAGRRKEKANRSGKSKHHRMLSPQLHLALGRSDLSHLAHEPQTNRKCRGFG